MDLCDIRTGAIIAWNVCSLREANTYRNGQRVEFSGVSYLLERFDLSNRCLVVRPMEG